MLRLRIVQGENLPGLLPIRDRAIQPEDSLDGSLGCQLQMTMMATKKISRLALSQCGCGDRRSVWVSGQTKGETRVRQAGYMVPLVGRFQCEHGVLQRGVACTLWLQPQMVFG